MKKTLHVIFWNERFTPEFLSFWEKNINLEGHSFYILGGEERVLDIDSSYNRNNLLGYLKLVCRLYSADIVVLHGLANFKLIIVLFLMQWKLACCYWLILGGDLYYKSTGKDKPFYRVKEFFRSRVIRKIGHLLTYLEGDVELARKWYGSSAVSHECLIYPSNFVIDLPNKDVEKTNDNLGVLVGNSADPTNNHFEILSLLNAKAKMKVYCPLSYGDKEYAKTVIRAGEEKFGSDFMSLLEMMSREEYLRFLESIDIAIFAHKRQQAMGNIISLLGAGKKVYLRKGTSQWELFTKLNVQVFDLFDMGDGFGKPFDGGDNKRIINDYFNKISLIAQYKQIFER